MCADWSIGFLSSSWPPPPPVADIFEPCYSDVLLGFTGVSQLTAREKREDGWSKSRWRAQLKPVRIKICIRKASSCILNGDFWVEPNRNFPKQFLLGTHDVFTKITLTSKRPSSRACNLFYLLSQSGWDSKVEFETKLLLIRFWNPESEPKCRIVGSPKKRRKKAILVGGILTDDNGYWRIGRLRCRISDVHFRRLYRYV